MFWTISICDPLVSAEIKRLRVGCKGLGRPACRGSASDVSAAQLSQTFQHPPGGDHEGVVFPM
jgi:hypothetical protein